MQVVRVTGLILAGIVVAVVSGVAVRPPDIGGDGNGDGDGHGCGYFHGHDGTETHGERGRAGYQYHTCVGQA